MAVAGILFCAAGVAAQEAAGPPGEPPAPQAASVPATTSAPTTTSAPVPLPVPNQADLLAADSLRHSAMSMIHAHWGVRGRAGRLVALAAYAQRLVPADVQTTWVLSGIYESRGQFADAEKAMERRLQAEPNDFGLGLTYLRVALAARAKPDDQQAFLQSVLENASWPEALRAQAAVELAKMALSNREKVQAQQWCSRTLQLDPSNVEALQGLMSLGETEPLPEESFRLMVTMFQSNPRAAGVLNGLASALAVVGLHEEAAPLFDAMWESATSAAPDALPPVPVASFYLNHLLDSKRYEQAVRIFDPLVEKYVSDRGFAYLMMEAYRTVGRPDRADQIAQRIIADIERSTTATQPSLLDAAELAWLYTVYYPKADLALSYARRLEAELGPDNPTIQRILGAAEMLSGEASLADSGQKRLEKVMAKDSLAAALLTERYLTVGNESAAAAAAGTALNVEYGGWAYRRIRDVAVRKDMVIPPHPKAQVIREIFEQLDPRYLDMGRHPEKYLAVTLRAVTDVWQVGEGLQIEAVLTNKGDLAVSLGPWGLIRAIMKLEATAPDLTKERFDNLPMVIWPAPKYLPPGQSVRTVVRIDVGSLEYFLARHPLEEVTLKVTGLLDLVRRGREMQSSVPGVEVAPLTITRKGLLGDFDRTSPSQWAKAYPHALRMIRTDLVRGDLPRRMRAARQLADLVTLVRDVELFKTRLPEALKGVIHKGVLLAMVREAMADPSEVVRAEMLAALGNAQLDESIISVLEPAAKDPHPLVRFRLVELLAASGMHPQAKTLERLSRDDDELVRQMASAFSGAATGGGTGP